jgi:dihydrolipoamide dehydrogenase
MKSPQHDTFFHRNFAMKTDVTIIGGGPGGYVAAIRMAQLGMNVALIEEKALGGVCLHWGCVPTKALYAATKLLEKTRTSAEIGITFPAPKIDLARLATWKGKIVSSLETGIERLLKTNGVTVINARGRLEGPGRVALSSGEPIEAERVVLATGSSPMEIPGFAFNEPSIWSSNDALALKEIPERLLVIGGGVIGLELATIYNRLGSAVTVLELMANPLPEVNLDRRVLSLLKRALNKQGITVHLESAATSWEKEASGEEVVVHTQDGRSFATDRILLAVGRRPNGSDIGLETVGIEPDHLGFVPVNDALETTSQGVYAIGDLIGGAMLAHKASAEGIKLAASFVGEEAPLNYTAIPQAIFTDPEIATVGLSETTAREKGFDPIVGRCPYAALGKAKGMREEDGLFQVVAEKGSHRLLGAQIIGAAASDLIAEAALALQNGLSLTAIINTVHPHPTLPEGLKEAAEDALGRAIHIEKR